MKVIQKYKYWKYSNLSMLQMSVQMYDLYIQMPNFILKKSLKFMEACLRHTLGYYLCYKCLVGYVKLLTYSEVSFSYLFCLISQNRTLISPFCHRRELFADLQSKML